jgi:SAM-dependent methyltransferase
MSQPSATLPDCAPELFAAEKRHFWFRARGIVLGRLVGQLVRDLAPGYRVLEVGCGNGHVLRILERVCVGGTVTGMDLSAQRLDFARSRTNCALRQGDLHQLPRGETFDLIGMFDVLEHVADDVGAVRTLSQVLTPNGRLVLTVPAHRSLWSYADTHAGHYRRYQVRQLEEVLTAGGLKVQYCTQFMAALFPLMWLGRRLSALWGGPQAGEQGEPELFLRELRIVPIVNGVLRRLLECEAPLIARRRRLPLGTSLLALARRLDGPSSCRS